MSSPGDRRKDWCGLRLGQAGGQVSGGGGCIGRNCLGSVHGPEAMKEEDVISRTTHQNRGKIGTHIHTYMCTLRPRRSTGCVFKSPATNLLQYNPERSEGPKLRYLHPQETKKGPLPLPVLVSCDTCEPLSIPCQ